jgi:hypothetical protein
MRTGKAGSASPTFCVIDRFSIFIASADAEKSKTGLVVLRETIVHGIIL